MRCNLSFSVGAVTLNILIFAPRLSLLFFLLCFLSRVPSAFIAPLSCFPFFLRVVISPILLSPAVIIPSSYIIPTILFYFLLSVISSLFFCRGILRGLHTHTHIMKLDCAVVFPSRCLPGNRPHPCMVYFPCCPPPFPPHVGIRS